MSGQVTRQNVSAFTRSRVHLGNIYALETRQVEANFNGLLPAGQTIESAVWQTWNTVQVIMSDASLSVNLRQTSIKVKFQYAGPALIKCTIFTSAGESYVQQFRFNILSAPVYGGQSWATGPQSLTVLASEGGGE